MRDRGFGGRRCLRKSWCCLRLSTASRASRLTGRSPQCPRSRFGARVGERIRKPRARTGAACRDINGSRPSLYGRRDVAVFQSCRRQCGRGYQQADRSIPSHHSEYPAPGRTRGGGSGKAPRPAWARPCSRVRLCRSERGCIFRPAYTRLGTNPDGGTTWTVTRLLGPRRALEWLMLGEPKMRMRPRKWVSSTASWQRTRSLARSMNWRTALQRSGHRARDGQTSGGSGAEHAA